MHVYVYTVERERQIRSRTVSSGIKAHQINTKLRRALLYPEGGRMGQLSFCSFLALEQLV